MSKKSVPRGTFIQLPEKNAEAPTISPRQPRKIDVGTNTEKDDICSKYLALSEEKRNLEMKLIKESDESKEYLAKVLKKLRHQQTIFVEILKKLTIEIEHFKDLFCQLKKSEVQKTAILEGVNFREYAFKSNADGQAPCAECEGGVPRETILQGGSRNTACVQPMRRQTEPNVIGSRQKLKCDPPYFSENN